MLGYKWYQVTESGLTSACLNSRWRKVLDSWDSDYWNHPAVCRCEKLAANTDSLAEALNIKQLAPGTNLRIRLSSSAIANVWMHGQVIEGVNGLQSSHIQILGFYDSHPDLSPRLQKLGFNIIAPPDTHKEAFAKVDRIAIPKLPAMSRTLMYSKPSRLVIQRYGSLGKWEGRE